MRLWKPLVLGSVALATVMGGYVAKAGTGGSEDGPDTFNVPGATMVTAIGSATFLLGDSMISITCADSSWTGKTRLRTTLKFPISPPTFSNADQAPCTDGSGHTYTVCANGTNGGWTVAELDYPNHGEGDEVFPGEPNLQGDHMQFTIPAAGLVITSSQGCTIILNPTQLSKTKGKYDDRGKFTVNAASLAIMISGGSQCPTDPGLFFSATYSLNPAIYDVG